MRKSFSREVFSGFIDAHQSKSDAFLPYGELLSDKIITDTQRLECMMKFTSNRLRFPGSHPEVSGYFWEKKELESLKIRTLLGQRSCRSPVEFGSRLLNQQGKMYSEIVACR